jgi:hypothetical protein
MESTKMGTDGPTENHTPLTSSSNQLFGGVSVHTKGVAERESQTGLEGGGSGQRP